MTQSGHVPGNWSELRAEIAALPGGSATSFLYFHGRMAGAAGVAGGLGADLAGGSEALIRGAVLEDPKVTAGLLPLAIDRARAVAKAPGPGAVADLAALALLTLEEAGGWGTPAPGPLLRRLPTGAGQSETVIRQAIWAGLAFGDIGPVVALDGAVTATQPDPSEHFDRAEWEAQRHLARCLAHGADAATARPAWSGYLATFPIHLGAKAATWAELLWAARATHVAVGGGSAGGLLSWLRSEVAAA
jgi:hypothetical protein